MCGIAGIISDDYNKYLSRLESAERIMHHRGPEYFGHFKDKNCYLSHNRLKIIDLEERSNQPFFSQNREYIIVFNGEIYNFKELAKKYSLNPKTRSDTEVLLETYILRGEKILNELNGMFAFSIFNKKTKEVFIARDRMGIKPLFYSFRNSDFIFSSELKWINHIKSDLKINNKSVYNYFHLGFIPEPETIYQNVFKFPAGSYCKFAAGDNKPEIKRFWSVKSKLNSESNYTGDLKDKLKLLIQQSVKRRLISDVPVGVFLSGGIDSSLIAAVAAEQSDKNINTFSIGFKEEKFNESHYAEKVAKDLNTNHETYILSHRDIEDRIQHVMMNFDEPFADTSALPLTLLSGEAKSKIVVSLSGDGGDELFYGYGTHKWANRFKCSALKLFSPILRQGLSAMSNSRYKRIAQLLKYQNNYNLYSHIFSQEQYFYREAELNQLLKNKSNNKFDPVFNDYSDFSYIKNQALNDLVYYLKDDLLVKVDRSTMLNSLENRVPLLDHEIVEFAVNLPDYYKMRNKTSKFLLKQVLYEYLPEHLFNRPKWGFSIPLTDWMKSDMKDFIEEYSNESLIREYNFVNFEYVNELKNKFYKDDKFNFYYNRIWLVALFHLWLKNQNVPRGT